MKQILENDKHNELLDQFITRINNEQFYDAHESLEQIWFPRRFEDSHEMKLLKGFINAAVCFELIKKGRHDASEKAWRNYIKYRPLLYKINSPYLNKYHYIIRTIEHIDKGKK